MNFSWTKDQLALKEKAVRFAEAELNHDLADQMRSASFPRESWKKCADFGIQGLGIPTRYGGQGEVDFLTAMLMMEGLGYGCQDNGLTFALNAQMWTVQRPILQFGTEQQKQRLLPALCRGEWIGAHAISEPEAGSDVFSMTTRAEKQDNGDYVLNGVKKFVSLGPIADTVLTFATVDPGLDKWGITAFVVERGIPGFRAGPVRDKMGLRTVPMGDLIFENCRLPAQSRLGPEGAGVSISTNSLEWERCSILASHLGAMERQLETSVRYAQARQQFGQPIGRFQSVSNRLADMKLRLETARLLLYKVAWMKSKGQQAMMEAALLKLHLSESFVQSSLDSVRIHGGNGYLTEYGIERDLRDAVGGILYAGTSDIQRNIIAQLLGL
ncbi:MAG: acyl-CoA dehydrogenase family protein [Chloroflexota bacterium]|nr:acyl-CoA dehydrogenase family protein [Chloroflexota bacterium]